MEPKLPAANRGPEHGLSVAPRSVEFQALSPTPERALEQRPEQLEKSAGMESVPSQATQIMLPPPITAPQPPTPIADDMSGQATASDTPLVANDDDLIEKEWVDKAKKIVTETKDDPYRREAEVGKLQVEYLRKRYGKELGASE